MKLTIERSKWLRGEGGDQSLLIRKSDGRMCCLGFLGLACGIPEEDLLDRIAPADIDNHNARGSLKPSLIRKGDYSNISFNTDSCIDLMKTNDRESYTEIEREESLRRQFRSISVDVTFED